MKEYIPAVALAVLIGGVFIEKHLWDETMNKTPDELSVTAFEIEEEGLSVVLTNAIEDQRAVVEHLTEKHDQASRMWCLCGSAGDGAGQAHWYPKEKQLARVRFQAMRVLGLLEATRERETGEKA